MNPPDEPPDMDTVKKGCRLLSEMLNEALFEHALPPPSPGRGKRQLDASWGLYVGIGAAMARRDDLHWLVERLVANSAKEAAEDAALAVQRADSDTLREIQEGLAAVAGAEQRHTGFSRHVVAVLRAKRLLRDEAGGADPFKADVRERATIILREQGIEPFLGDDRWKEIFTAAGLGYLPQKRASRGKSKWSE
jgi:hypothetical protein